MLHPKISVIMAVYNAAPFLEESVYSILNQTFKDFELLLVDDASTDTSSEIIHRLVLSDQRIRVISNLVNVGQAQSRNNALTEAHGLYVAIADADDIAYPRRLETQYAFLQTHPDIALVGSGADIVNKDGFQIGRKYQPVNFNVIKWTLLTRNVFVASTVMFRKDILDKSGGYETAFTHSEDYRLYSNLVWQHNCTLANLPDHLVKYRVAPLSSTTTASTRSLQMDRALAISKKNIGQYMDINDLDIQNLHAVFNYTDNRLFPIFRAMRTYRTLLSAYLQKETLPPQTAKEIENIYHEKRRLIVRQYLKSNLPMLSSAVKYVRKFTELAIKS